MTAASSCPEPHAICAWHGHIDRIWPNQDARTRALGWLSSTERERYSRFRHDADREMFLLGRAMARTLVGRALGVAPAAWPWREGPRGRPEIALADAPVSFNVAHSGGVVVCALAREAEVGIDIEDRRRPTLDRDLVDRYCSPTEAADVDARGESGWRDRFLQYWTLKEAYLKARGLGIAVHLSDLSFTIRQDHTVSVAFIRSLTGADPNWDFELRTLDDRYVVAVAASTPGGIRPAFALEPFPVALLS